MTDVTVKTKIDTRTLLFAVALTALAMGKAHGAELRTAAAVTGDTITVGDVFDGTGEYASRYLAPAPARGESVTLNASDLTRIADAFHLGWKPSGKAETITLRREIHEIDRYAIQAALQEKLSEQLGDQAFDMELADKNAALALPAGAEKTAAATNVRVDLQKNTFTATIEAPAGAPVARKDVSGRIFTLVRVPVLSSAARPGDIIGANDLDYIDMRSADLSTSIIADASHLVGQTPRRGIAAMKPVSASDIQAPMLVKKGDLVTVALQAGGLGLTMQGRALENGAAGDIVRVINTASNRMIEGTVTGASTVALRLPSATL